MSTLELLLASALLCIALIGAALMLFSAQDTLTAAQKDLEAIALLPTTVPRAPQTNTCSALTTLATSSAQYAYPTASLPTGGIQISALQTKNYVLYVAARTSSNGNTLYLFSLAGPHTPPTYLGSLDNIPSVSSAGLNSIAVAGGYVYGASGYGANFTSCAEAANCAQLQVFAAQDVAHPRLVANRKVGGVTGSTGQGAGSTIFYSNGYLYLGLTKTSGGPEFIIFDVGANIGSSTNPIQLGTFAVGRTINSLMVIGNTVYLATDDNSKELVSLDVTDKTHPKLLATFNAPGTSNFGYGFSIAQAEDSLMFGRSYVGNAPELYHLSRALALLHSRDIGLTAQPDGVDALLATKDNAVILTNNTLSKWNTNTNTLSNILSLSTLGSIAVDRRGALACTETFLIAAIPLDTNQDTLSFIATP
jgi:hypothetical protein